MSRLADLVRAPLRPVTDVATLAGEAAAAVGIVAADAVSRWLPSRPDDPVEPIPSGSRAHARGHLARIP